MISVALASVALAGCDAAAPPNRAEAPSADAIEPDAGIATALPSAEVLAEALSDPDDYARVRRLGVLLPSLGPEAVAAVAQTLGNFRLDLGAAEFELLLRFWASQDPSAATAWALGLNAAYYKVLAIPIAVELWARADPAAAVAGVTGAAGRDREAAQAIQIALVKGWSQTDRPGLEKYIYGLGSGPKRQRSLFAYLRALAAEGSDTAIRWGEAIPEEDTRYKLAVYRQIMSVLSWVDMLAAMRFCDAHCDGPYGAGLRNVLIRNRLRNGEYGGDVVEWVARVPDGDAQKRENKEKALAMAFALWAFRDSASAMDWIEGKIGEGSTEPWLRPLIGTYALQLAASSPAEAIQWAEQVEYESREVLLIRIARSWLTQDPEAAEAWLNQSSLSESAREEARDTTQPNYLPDPSPR